MKRLPIGSTEYKKVVRVFVSEKRNRPFTYNEFTNWLMNKQLIIGTMTGHKSYEQAIFSSLISHEYNVVKNYRERQDRLETVFLVS